MFCRRPECHLCRHSFQAASRCRMQRTPHHHARIRQPRSTKSCQTHRLTVRPSTAARTPGSAAPSCGSTRRHAASQQEQTVAVSYRQHPSEGKQVSDAERTCHRTRMCHRMCDVHRSIRQTAVVIASVAHAAMLWPSSATAAAASPSDSCVSVGQRLPPLRQTAAAIVSLTLTAMLWPSSAMAAAASAVTPTVATAAPVMSGLGGILIGSGACVAAAAFAVLVFFSIPTLMVRLAVCYIRNLCTAKTHNIE